MSHAAKQGTPPKAGAPRVLGRGLRARRGVRMTLRTLREAAGKTQVAVAESAGMDQADVSRLESRTELDECQVATLKRYVAALGGELDLVARFGNKQIVLVGIAEANSAQGPSTQTSPKPRRNPGRR